MKFAPVLIVLVACSFSCDRQPSSFTLVAETDWLPTEPKVYYLEMNSGRANLMRVGLNGAHREAISGRDVWEFSLTKDGRRAAIVYGSQRECGVVDLDTLVEFLLPGPCEQIEANPDRSLYAIWEGGKLSVFKRLTGERSDIAVNVRRDARWSVEGELLYCERNGYRWYAWSPDSGSTRFIAEGRNETSFWREFGVDKIHFNQYDCVYVNWLYRVSPSGEFRAISDLGSLKVETLASSETRTVLRNEGGFNPDAAINGFYNPYWTSNDEFIIGQIEGDIVVVEVETGKAAVIAKGIHPMVWINGYQIPGAAASHLGAYMWLKLGGY